jgi:hypothetical protein
VPVVDLISHFSPRDTGIFSIKHDAHLPIFHVWCISRLVLALKHTSKTDAVVAKREKASLQKMDKQRIKEMLDALECFHQCLHG